MDSLNLNRAEKVTDEIALHVDDMFAYHPWSQDQTAKGLAVRRSLAEAYKVIIENVPASQDRSTALRKIREASMDCNSAITHGGKF